METLQQTSAKKYVLEHFSTPMLRSLAKKCLIPAAEKLSREKLVLELHDMLRRN